MNKVEQVQAGGVVTVFSPEGVCVQCAATLRVLDAKGIPYHVVKVSDSDDDTRATLRELGFMQFPVVWAPRVGYWSGFRPDKLDETEAAR